MAKLKKSSFSYFLSPFIAELRDGHDDRLRSHVEERIFRHLMRQSDAGIEYEQVRKKKSSNFNDTVLYPHFIPG